MVAAAAQEEAMMAAGVVASYQAEASFLQAGQGTAAERLEAVQRRAELDEAERVSSMPRNWFRPYSLAAHLVCGRQSRRVRFLCERRYLSACCRCF